MIRRPGIKLSRPTQRLKQNRSRSSGGGASKSSSSTSSNEDKGYLALRRAQALQGLLRKGTGLGQEQQAPADENDLSNDSFAKHAEAARRRAKAGPSQQGTPTNRAVPSQLPVQERQKRDLLEQRDARHPQPEAGEDEHQSIKGKQKQLKHFYQAYRQNKARMSEDYLTQILVLRNFYTRYLSGSVGNRQTLSPGSAVASRYVNRQSNSSYFAGHVIDGTLHVRLNLSEIIDQLQNVETLLAMEYAEAKRNATAGQRPIRQVNGIYASLEEVQKERRTQIHYKQSLDIELEKLLSIFNPAPQDEDFEFSLLNSYQIVGLEKMAKDSMEANAWKNRFVKQSQLQLLDRLSHNAQAKRQIANA